MKHIKVLFFVASIFVLFEGQTQVPLDSSYFNSLKYKHDLNLPDWGPYTKNYIGVSHIPDIDKGIRFDLSVFPGFYRRKVNVPNVFFETGYHPWEASPNLEYYSFRHELEWKDKVYTDVSYSELGKNARAVRITCVNNTDIKQSIALHLMASIHFPSLRPYSPNKPIQPMQITLPENSRWVEALDYHSFEYALPSHKNNLVYDGMMRGEQRENGLVNGSGVLFGKHKGDAVAYSVAIDKNIKDPVLYIRYKTNKISNMSLSLSGAIEKEITLAPTKKLKTGIITNININYGASKLKIVAKNTSGLLLDGFAIVSASDTALISLEKVNWNHIPELSDGPLPNSIIIKYPNTENYYGLYWDYDDFHLRELFFKDLSDDFQRLVNNHFRSKLYNGTNGHYTNVFIRPVNLEPQSSSTIDAFVCTGTKDEVHRALQNIKAKDIVLAEQKAKTKLLDYDIVPAGEKYLFSQKRMAATTAVNVVYPVYTQKQYIRHHTPGRWWDCLYTWDSGFNGLGLTQLNAQRGIESLNTYVQEPNEQSAFIHHGTPIPVQHYLFQEIWHLTQSNELVENYYPKLKRYYEFLAGKAENSNTATLNSGLIRTWGYFYNSGWDDYPPQSYMHNAKLSRYTASAIITAHVIRIAKILKLAARHLNLQDDIIAYDKDIKGLSSALNKHAWDKEAGYYGYVVHDKKGNAESILKYRDSINYNMGMGGASPIIADICDSKQQEQLLKHLKTKGELWTDIGLSAVDQSAPYYTHEGYWNGAVWMPHQWFFWKSMLDLGEDDFAHKIATTALDLWKKETDDTYNCYEHFVIETGRGAGWHQFGGLSTPVLSWFNSYYKQGTLTVGHNVWIKSYAFNKSKTELDAEFSILKNNSDSLAIVVCLNPNYKYTVSWNGKELSHKEFNKGTLSVRIPNSTEYGKLHIKRK